MPSTCVKLTESEVIKLVLEFLTNRELNITMLSLERETGVINGVFSDDLLFLRQLILDGQWDDVNDFVQPLGSMESFDLKKFQYIICRHKYLELLCLKAEAGQSQNYDLTVEELVKCVNQLEKLCPSKEDYSNLCLLLTLPKLSDHADYRSWNPSNARVECFKEVYPIIEKFLPLDKHDTQTATTSTARDDRLVQLLIKGVLYESCVEYCQQKATKSDLDNDNMTLMSVLSGGSINDNDVSLLSWLQAVPFEVFNCPFEKKKLSIDVQPLNKPALEASWSEQILVTPIKPKMFPHSAIPSQRARSTDFMSRSLMPQYDGLAYGLTKTGLERMSFPADFPGSMSKSFAAPGFHLNVGAKNKMQTSMDKVFDDSSILDTQSSMIIENTPPPPAKPKSPRMSLDSPPSSPQQGMNKISTPISHEPGKASGLPSQSISKRSALTMASSDGAVDGSTSRQDDGGTRDSSSELYQQYQKQRLKLQEQLEVQEKQRMVYQQQLMELDTQTQLSADDNRLADRAAERTADIYSTPLKQKQLDQLIDDDGQKGPAPSPMKEQTHKVESPPTSTSTSTAMRKSVSDHSPDHTSPCSLTSPSPVTTKKVVSKTGSTV